MRSKGMKKRGKIQPQSNHQILRNTMEVRMDSALASPQLNLDALIDQFIAEVCAGKTNETPAAYLTKLRFLKRFIEQQQIHEISQLTIDQFRIWLLTRKTKVRGKREVNGSLSPFTIRTVITTVRHFLRWANERGYLPKIVLKNIKEPQPDPKPISQQTFERLLNAANSLKNDWERARDIAILLILRDTGGRCGSIARINITNLDIKLGTAIVLDKGGRYSWLFFGPTTSQAIETWITYRNSLHPFDDTLFIGQSGHAMNRRSIRRVLDKLAKIAGVEHERYNPHAFRHAFARDTLLAGADLTQTSQLLNHSTIVTTARYYARWSKKELAEIHHKYSPLNGKI